MIDAASALKTAYWAFLQGTTYEGKAVEVFSNIVPSGATAPYIIIGSWQPQSDNTKTSFGQKGEITLQVVDRMHASVYSEVRANAISNTITGKLKPTPTAEPLVLNGFTHFSTIGPVDGLSMPNAVDVVYRQIIVITHQLCQIQ